MEHAARWSADRREQDREMDMVDAVIGDALRAPVRVDTTVASQRLVEAFVAAGSLRWQDLTAQEQDIVLMQAGLISRSRRLRIMLAAMAAEDDLGEDEEMVDDDDEEEEEEEQDDEEEEDLGSDDSDVDMDDWLDQHDDAWDGSDWDDDMEAAVDVRDIVERFAEPAGETGPRRQDRRQLSALSVGMFKLPEQDIRGHTVDGRPLVGGGTAYYIRTASVHRQCANSLLAPADNIFVLLCQAYRRTLCICQPERRAFMTLSLSSTVLGMCVTRQGVALAAESGGVSLIVPDGRDFPLFRVREANMANSVQRVLLGGEEYVIVAGNDGHIYWCRLPHIGENDDDAEVDEPQRLNARYRMNDARLSPDGKWLAAVGDTDSLFLWPATFSAAGGLSFGELEVVAVTPRGQSTGSISRQYLSWNATSTHVAVSCDSGAHAAVVEVAPVRSVRPLMTAGSTLAVAFSPNNPNLLAIACARRTLHVVDIQVGTRQSIPIHAAMPATFSTGRIVGLAWGPSGLTLHAALDVGVVSLRLRRPPSLFALASEAVMRDAQSGALTPDELAQVPNPVREALGGMPAVAHAILQVPPSSSLAA